MVEGKFRGFVCIGRGADGKVSVWLAKTLNKGISLGMEYVKREFPKKIFKPMQNEKGGYIYPFSGMPITRVTPWPTVTVAPLIYPQQSAIMGQLCTVGALAQNDGFTLLFFTNPQDCVTHIEGIITPHGGYTTTDGEVFYHIWQESVAGFTIPISNELLTTVNRLPQRPILN